MKLLRITALVIAFVVYCSSSLIGTIVLGIVTLSLAGLNSENYLTSWRGWAIVLAFFVWYFLGTVIAALFYGIAERCSTGPAEPTEPDDDPEP